MDSKATTIQAPRKRNLGFDLFRFWGVFLIFIGHNYYVMNGFTSNISNVNMEILNAPNWWQEFWYPSIWINLVLTGVPLFIMIHGFHSLGKPCGPNDWVKTKTDFVKYVVFWGKWAIIGALLTFIAPSIWGNPIEGMTTGQAMELFLENVICTQVTKGFNMVTAINWTVLALSWASVLCFILRPLFQSKNIQAIRICTAIACVMCVINPTIRDLGTYFLAKNPDSLVALFFSNFTFFDTTGFNTYNWYNFWFPMLMLGGWYAVDTKVRDKVRSWSWGVTLAVSAVLVVIFVYITHFGGLISEYAATTGTAINIYWRCGWMPASFAWFIIADKINATCSEDSKLGRFIAKYGTDNIGAMIISYPFGSTLQKTVLLFVYEWMFDTFKTPFGLSAAFLIYNVLFYAVLILIVHYLRPVFAKVPFLRGLLYWDKITLFDKEKKAIVVSDNKG